MAIGIARNVGGAPLRSRDQGLELLIGRLGLACKADENREW